MVDLSDLITGIRDKIAGNTFLNDELTNNGQLQVTLGQMGQQAGSAQTAMPYCVLYQIGSPTQGFFGNTFLDKPKFQFSIFATTLADASALVQELGLLLNNTNLTLADNTLVYSKRASSPRAMYSGQDQNNNYVYQGSVDFEFALSGC